MACTQKSGSDPINLWLKLVLKLGLTGCRVGGVVSWLWTEEVVMTSAIEPCPGPPPERAESVPRPTTNRHIHKPKTKRPPRRASASERQIKHAMAEANG